MLESRTSCSSPRLSVQRNNSASSEATDGHSEVIGQAFEQFSQELHWHQTWKPGRYVAVGTSINYRRSEYCSIVDQKATKRRRHKSLNIRRIQSNSCTTLKSGSTWYQQSINWSEKVQIESRHWWQPKAALAVIKKRQKLIKLALR